MTLSQVYILHHLPILPAHPLPFPSQKRHNQPPNNNTHQRIHDPKPPLWTQPDHICEQTTSSERVFAYNKVPLIDPRDNSKRDLL